MLNAFAQFAIQTTVRTTRSTLLRNLYFSPKLFLNVFRSTAATPEQTQSHLPSPSSRKLLNLEKSNSFSSWISTMDFL